MRLLALEAKNFRNLQGRLEPCSGLNILVGENGRGKTNWLESIQLLSSARSFRTSRLQESIKFGEDLAIVTGQVQRSEEITRELKIVLQGKTKSLAVNGKKAPLSEYLEELHAVVFNSDTIDLVRGQPDTRRRFLDEAIVAVHPPFVKTYSDYARVLRQKNSLLQTARDSEYSLDKITELLEPWNEQLAVLAARIHKGRMRIVERLSDALENRLFGEESVSVRYMSSLEGKGNLADYENLIAERLRLRVQAETVAGHSLVGPHRDDLEIKFDGRELRKFGSAGQQRSAVLVLQLATLSIFNSLRDEYPLFLLDDLDAELDYRRIGQLLDYLDSKTQTFVTTSKDSFIEKFGRNARIFCIENGTPKIR